MAQTNHWKQQVLQGAIDHSTATLDVALGSDDTAYTFDPASHEFVADVLDGGTTATEFTGTGYSRQTLGGLSVTQDDTDGEGVFDANDVTFTGLDGDTIQFILIYQQVGSDDTTPADDPIVVLWDDDSAGSLADLPLTTNGGDVTISFATEGVINIT